MPGRRHLAAAEFADRLAIRAFLPETILREFDHLAVIGRHEARGAEEIGLPQPPTCHLFRVVLKAEMRPDEIEGIGTGRHDMAGRKGVDLLLVEHAWEKGARKSKH